MAGCSGNVSGLARQVGSGLSLSDLAKTGVAPNQRLKLAARGD